MSLSSASFCKSLMSRSCCRYITHRSRVTLHLGSNNNDKINFNFNLNVNRNMNLKFDRFMATEQHRRHDDGLHVEHKESQPEQTYKSTSNGGNKWSRNRKLMLGVTIGAGVSAIVGYTWYAKYKEGQPPDILTFTLKMGILASQKDDFEKAQHFFHKGLELAHQQHLEKLIDDKQLLLMQINIFGLMATTAVRSGDFVNAEKLYKDTMQKCILAGRAQDDDSVVELSIKLSSLYAMMSRDNEAEAGFKFCVKTMDEKVKAMGGVLESDTNTLALQGLSVQSYARFLMRTKKYSQAVELYKQSLDVAREVYGADHPQALVVLNDLASAYVINKQYKEGRETYEEAVSRAERSEDMHDSLVAFYYNLGETCILTKDFTAAKSNCIKCLDIANKVGTPALIKAGEQCLKDIQEVQAKEGNKT